MVSSPTNVAFFGTPEFAVPTLLGLVKSPEINLQIVVTQPDRPAGRKSSPSFTAVKAAAVEHEIPHILQPSLIDDDFLTTLTSLNVEAIIVIASGHMLPKTLCEHYGDRIVNLHASLLPKHRGASPISAALLSGDSETGVSLMQVVHKLDSGPIFAQKTLQISESDTTDSLSLSLSLLARELLLTNLQSWLASEIRPTPQNADDVTYAKKIVATDAKIDWNQPSAQIAKFIRAYIPWPVAYTEYQGQRFRIHESHSLPKFPPTSSIGSVIQLPDNRIAVQCGTGALQLSLIQKEGRKMMPVADFLNGNADFIGSVLG
tara:strand:+ start:57 stop:1007 length:951 start_codon:yes stop_codon:yes gene_type:complete